MMLAYRFCLLSLLLAAPIVGIAELRVDLSLKSKPSYRGILQARDNNPVAQALVEYLTDSGLYVGVWASRLQTDRDDRHSEIDYFVGYQYRASPWLAFDLTLQQYTYQGGDFGSAYDWTELQLATHLGDHLTLLGAAGKDWVGRGKRSYVIEASYQYALSHYLTAYATLGQHFAEDVIPDDFAYQEIGMSWSLALFNMQLSWTDTTGTDTAGFRTNDTISISISRQFRF